MIDKAHATENNYKLSPSRYLPHGGAKVMREIPELAAELAALKKVEARLDQELAKVLAQL